MINYAIIMFLNQTLIYATKTIVATIMSGDYVCCLRLMCFCLTLEERLRVFRPLNGFQDEIQEVLN